MDHRERAVLDLLGESLSSTPSVQELADAVNLSPSHLRRLFKAEIGTPLNQYVKSLRLEKSKELMEQTFLNMKQIMFAVGVKISRSLRETSSDSQASHQLSTPHAIA